jgi:hypothetical protein
MAEVVLQLPVAANEDQIFGRFLDRFMESRSRDVERMASSSDAPYLMIHTDPALGEFMRILTFQEADAASAFSTGWAQARARTA